MLALALARSAGLAELAGRHLSVPTDKGANAGLKVASLVAAAQSGRRSADSQQGWPVATSCVRMQAMMSSAEVPGGTTCAPGSEWTMSTGAGADRLYSGQGHDVLEDSRGSAVNTLRGGPGADLIYTNYSDRVFAGDGNDRLVVAYPGVILINCGPGDDQVTFKPAARTPTWSASSTSGSSRPADVTTPPAAAPPALS